LTDKIDTLDELLQDPEMKEALLEKIGEWLIGIVGWNILKLTVVW
jgi:hypothetical protein